MRLFPTEDWLDEYARRLDESAALDDLAAGWGADFNGDVLLVISELPLEETTLDDLPDVVLEGIPEPIQEGIGELTLADAPSAFGDSLRPSLPAQARELLYQLETNVTDETIYAYLGLEEGRCTGVETLSKPSDCDVGFVVEGTYRTWQQIVDGRPALSAMMTGDLRVEGNQFRQLQYSTMFQQLGEVAAGIETTHLFGTESRDPANVLFDEAVRQPAFIQRTAHQQLNRTLKLF